MKRLRKAAGLIAVGVVAIGAAGAFAGTLMEVPPYSGFGVLRKGDIDPYPLSQMTGTASQARALTPDGRYVVGLTTGTYDADGTATQIGNLWEVTNGMVGSGRRVDSTPATSAASILTGAGYRTIEMGEPSTPVQQLVLQGISTGWNANWFSLDGGLTFGAIRRDVSTCFEPPSSCTGPCTSPILGVANTLAGTGSDLWYHLWRWTDYRTEFTKGSGAGDPPSANVAPKSSATRMWINAVSSIGRAAGTLRTTSELGNQYENYVLTFVEPVPPACTASPKQSWFTALDETLKGEAYAISADGTRVFGRSVVLGGRAGTWPYVVVDPVLLPNRNEPYTTSTAYELPTYPDTAGSTSNGLPYGCSADGDFAAGMNYRGAERAVLWDVRDANPANWKIYDLTAYFDSLGQLAPFIVLSRAYSVAVDTTSGTVVVAGIGATGAGTRGFVATIALSEFPLPDTGACCMIGSCTSKFAVDCPDIADQQRWTAKTLCANAACPGACCTEGYLMTGACSDFVESATCTDGGGVFRGASSACAAGACLGSCCKTDGTCEEEPLDHCTSIDGLGGALGSTCGDSTCLGACCLTAGDCQERKYGGDEDVDGCSPAKFKGIGTICEEDTCPCSIPFADADGDGDVDQADFAVFQACYTGQGGTLATGCECYDVHPAGAGDSDIDTDDWAAFEACASGAGIAADAACDDAP
jgi:hypothetical protein